MVRSCLLAAFFAIVTCVSAMERKGYYVVVGAFAVKKNAEKFQKMVSKDGFDCRYSFLESRNLYYVYTAFAETAAQCRGELKRVKDLPQYADAWMFYSDKANNIAENQVDVPESVVVKPSAVAAMVAEDTSLVIKPRQEAATVTGPVAVTEPELPEVFLSLFHNANDRVVEGTVSVVDTDRATLIKELKGNTYTTLPDPKNKSGKVTLICEALGYRKIQYTVAPKNLITDSTAAFIEDVGTAIMVNFQLVKYLKGDLRTLYDVYFYNDSNIMMGESKYELNQLEKMMAENPTYKIVLHGHTNGNSFGKIVLRADDGDFFTLPRNAKSQSGSAKKLSLMRAETIQQYLVSKGIDKNRVLVKGWGGSRSIYDKNSANAKKNVRVDVELLEN